MAGLEAVSYTHLDVYKRQDDSLTPLFLAIAIAIACHDRLLLDFKSQNWHSPLVTKETSE